MIAKVLYMVKSMKMDAVVNMITQITGQTFTKYYSKHLREHWCTSENDHGNLVISVETNFGFDYDYEVGNPDLPIIHLEEFDIEDIEVGILAHDCRDPLFCYFTDHPEIFIPASAIWLFDPDNPAIDKDGHRVANHKIWGPLPQEFR